ncbi:MAG: anti-sigma factor [Leeuwenhoekiella sp.]
MEKQIYLLGLLVSSLLVLLSCDSEDDVALPNPSTDLSLTLSGLEPLGAGYAYEGWVIVNGAPVSTGTFTVNGTGQPSPASFNILDETLDAATMFVVSIEPVPDPDPAPAATKVLAGPISNGSATLSTGIVGDFSGSNGTFFLRTPTDETDGNNGNDQYGVWFGDPGMPPTANFSLPVLPAGWAYEGWVVGDSGPITTGTFTAFGMSDAAAPFSETAHAAPPIPGEDFFLNAPAGETFPLDVRGRTVVISVEPVPDDSPAPFAMKPLLGTSGDATAPATHALGTNLGSLPTGSISF